MSLEQLCLEQEESIEKQAAQIRALLSELLQFRALTKEEARLLTEVAMFRELTQAEEEYAAAFHAGEGKT